MLTQRTLMGSLALILALVCSVLLAGCSSTTGKVRAAAPPIPSASTEAPPATAAVQVTIAPTHPAELWTWIITQNDKITHLYCQNKPVFSNTIAECIGKDGTSTFVAQGPLVEVKAGEIPLSPEAPVLTWIVTQNDRVTHLYCRNKPVFSSNMAECIREDGSSTYVAQGPLVETKPGKVPPREQEVAKYTWEIVAVMVGASRLDPARLYCTNPPIAINGYAECRHSNGKRSYVAQSVTIVALPGWDR